MGISGSSGLRAGVRESSVAPAPVPESENLRWLRPPRDPRCGVAAPFWGPTGGGRSPRISGGAGPCAGVPSAIAASARVGRCGSSLTYGSGAQQSLLCEVRASGGRWDPRPRRGRPGSLGHALITRSAPSSTAGWTDPARPCCPHALFSAKNQADLLGHRPAVRTLFRRHTGGGAPTYAEAP